MTIEEIFTFLNDREIFFRFENDEDGYYLSIIDRKQYPRVWADKMREGKVEMLAETTDSLISRTTIGDKDWTHRFDDQTIEGLVKFIIDSDFFKKVNS